MVAKDLSSAYPFLDAADGAVRELHEDCCQPLRSPRMEKLAQTITAARQRLDQAVDPESAEAVISVLEDAGGQLGFLQVACCTPARTRLYSETLQNLSRVQRLLTREFGLDH
ncbi:MAG TPA: hypothetical protein VKZ65_07785 [Glycomyces sp.]|nr:hypothetical protein [Glycomyces sp.]